MKTFRTHETARKHYRTYVFQNITLEFKTKNKNNYK